ncbi:MULTISPECIES: AAA-like domain-containing protein [unclassified Nodularia (in: cyanobacteria)]|uniref:AAA-like domain-containing protein n=1 Tax=unclassified Nodularia (in: cyanobacteria) TaxID=2656917 RepID=UPI001880B197|nr:MULTISPECIES: AAA-like domain-containing protein [unclassified Nodularia (in: cyanobacteria)]MBE9200678.1 AAA-like domain-containing protein [Nodularia sp. LEGE 06071]MCC2694791.1 AAA-like domain-containing protein [Nodularia sp. LEGE 04288]
MVDQYIFSGSLPENASTYVIREADTDLYAGLTAGKFCYVLNSRQSGKSSLRVRTMQRLRNDGVQCAAIDLSAGGIQNVPPEQWYADLIDTLIDSFEIDLDFGDWWEANQLNSLVTRFRKFLEEVLLVKVPENIVIFIDEIDSVLSLNFPTDDFFALIRACYNKRVDNPEYNRLTFCLLGVASPSNLIGDKQRTPFNIGQAISLKGFQLHEAEPLKKGFYGKFSNPQGIIQEILQWTGGQPFLTQKLCQFMVEESEQENPRSVEQVVRSRIIENWESQDEPEHLRTIQARILRDEQRAGYLLELYQQVRLSEEKSEVIADDTLEQSELQLSGLVVRQHGKLKIYNQIYREIFEINWIENQLQNLRPYSESFRFWVASGFVDDSRLLRGKALQEAEAWARDKNLSYQDKQFLAASKEKEIQQQIAAQEQEAALERERKDRDAAEQINKKLHQANKKAQGLIRRSYIIVIVTLIGASLIAVAAINSGKELINTQKELEDIIKSVADKKQILNLADKLSSADKNNLSDKIKILAEESDKMDDIGFKQALLHTSIALAYQHLGNKTEAEKALKRSTKFWEASKSYKEQKSLSNLELELNVFMLNFQGNLFKEENKQKARQFYTEAFTILQTYPELSSKILDSQVIESVHRSLIELLSTNTPTAELKPQVEQSLTKHLYAQLEYFLDAKNWEAANRQTERLMLNIAQREKEGDLDLDNINSFSCPDLQRIDQLWVNADNRFGFRVQKEIWISTKNRLGIKPQDWIGTDSSNYLQFAKKVGWWHDNVTLVEGGMSFGVGDGWVSFEKLIKFVVNSGGGRGSLPTFILGVKGSAYVDTYSPNQYAMQLLSLLALRLVKCNL